MSDKEETRKKITTAEYIRKFEAADINKYIARGNSIVKIFGKYLFEEDDVKNIAEDDELYRNLYNSISKRLRELLKIDNFSILTGAGSSYNILNLSCEKKELLENGWVYKLFSNDLGDIALYNEFKNVIERTDGIEAFLAFLFRLESLSQYGIKEFMLDGKTLSLEQVREIKERILTKLIKKCKTPVSTDPKDHKQFLKRIITRPINLKRANLFTLNYDLLFEKAMDELGLIYVDGFIGGIDKYFHPEAFNYDFYYPAATTEGKVSRMEKVLHFYKLHGSISWIETQQNTSLNIYNIKKKYPSNEEKVVIYPTPLKEQDTLGFPYSELFRKFANTIQQPQSVLITFGYSFGDAHVNRIIYEALSIPTFHLVVVSYGWSTNIRKLFKMYKNEDSISFIIGRKFGSWNIFSNKLLPEMATLDLEERYAEKRKKAQQILRQNNSGHSEEEIE